MHCFGYRASEIVHIGQAIMNQKGPANSIKYFVNTTFNYPTMAEAYRVAAFDGSTGFLSGSGRRPEPAGGLGLPDWHWPNRESF